MTILEASRIVRAGPSLGGERSPEMLFAHGALGSRRNWQSFARQFVDRRPGWGALLVDLRGHGDNPPISPPHTLRAAAIDLVDTARRANAAVNAALGHSLGGSIALHMAMLVPLSELWLIDSNPGASAPAPSSSGLLQALDLLESLAYPLSAREELVDAARTAGLSERTARFLATSLVRSGTGFELRVDVGAVRSMLDEHWREDRWPLLEGELGETTIHLVIGAESDVFDRRARERAHRACERNPRLHVAVIEGAGHWVHIDAPQALLDLMAPSSTKDPTEPEASTI